MSENEAEKLLQKIASQPKKKGAARLRDMFDSLEAALSVKTREEVFKELEQINLGISLNTFRKTIDRIRKERGILKSRKKGTTNQEPTQSQTTVSSPAADETETPALTAPEQAPTPNALKNGASIEDLKNILHDTNSHSEHFD